MSIDFGASIVVGFRFTFEEALKPFEVKVGEDEFVEEDRFDEKTGQKKGTEKVRTSSSIVKHVWKDLSTNTEDDGEELDPEAEFEEIGETDFLEKLAERNGLEFLYYGDCQGDNAECVFYPKRHPKDLTDGYDWGRLTTGGNLDWAQVSKMGKILDAVRKKLVKLGLKPGKPEVVLAASVS